jgi:integrase
MTRSTGAIISEVLLMAGKQAKILSETVTRRALRRLNQRASPPREKAMFLLSVRAGLRACEIAGLDWSMVTEPNGRVSRLVTVHDRIAKKRRGRRIPMHDELRRALLSYASTVERRGPVFRSSRTGGHMRPNSVVNWFVWLFAEIGAVGCSSHSGRRTFITMAARRAHRAGASLRDVQLLAGHQSIEVTQGYIDGDTDAQRRLVASL